SFACPPSNGSTIHRPSSSPLRSSNHQIEWPLGSKAPFIVPSGRSVTWRCVSERRSHAYSSHLPPEFDAYRSRSESSLAQDGRVILAATNRRRQAASVTGEEDRRPGPDNVSTRPNREEMTWTR